MRLPDFPNLLRRSDSIPRAPDGWEKIKFTPHGRPGGKEFRIRGVPLPGSFSGRRLAEVAQV